nr:hypothetical protein Iba_chr15bCG9600 [Ipomoea batatas]
MDSTLLRARNQAGRPTRQRHHLDELHRNIDGVVGGEVNEGVGLVGLGGAAAGQVRERPDNDVRHLLLVADEGHSGALHFDGANVKLFVYEVPVGGIVEPSNSKPYKISTYDKRYFLGNDEKE